MSDDRLTDTQALIKLATLSEKAIQNERDHGEMNAKHETHFRNHGEVKERVTKVEEKTGSIEESVSKIENNVSELTQTANEFKTAHQEMKGIIEPLSSAVGALNTRLDKQDHEKTQKIIAEAQREKEERRKFWKQVLSALIIAAGSMILGHMISKYILKPVPAQTQTEGKKS